MTKFLPSQSTPSTQIIQSPYMPFLFALGQTCPESCPRFRKHCSSSAQSLRVCRPQCCVGCTQPHKDVTPDSREHLGHRFLLSSCPQRMEGRACMHVHAHTGWLLLKGTRGLSYSLTSKWPFIEFLFLDLGQPKFRLQTWGDFSLSYNYKQSASILWGKTLPYTRTDLSKLWRQWRTEEAGVLQSMGLKRVRRNLETEQQQYRFTHTICLYIIRYMHMYAYTLKYIL